MGTYCHLSIGGFRLFQNKGGVWDAQTGVFTPQDRRIWQRPARERLGYELGEEDEYVDAEALEQLEGAVAYRLLAWRCIDRLNTRGKTLTKARAEYETTRQSILEGYTRDRMALAGEGLDLDLVLASSDRWSYGLESSRYEGSETLYRSLDFDSWLRELGSYVRRNADAADQDHHSEPDREPSETEAYILRCGDEEREMGFLCCDYLLLLRCLLEVVDRKTLVELDISDLILNGYLGEEEEVARTEPYFTILTEGKSDKWILERTLAILYPHLAPYYKFADFEAANLPGGIANNVQVVRTFIALSIQDHLIVLFDNDAAGVSAVRSLSSLAIPPNVRIMTLPDLKRARCYPTVGPGGQNAADVNSQAVSIEFFFGIDVLEQGGILPNVRWKSFQPDIGLYQGELERKSELQKEYDRLLSNPERYSQHDWSDMRTLFESILGAFV